MVRKYVTSTNYGKKITHEISNILVNFTPQMCCHSPIINKNYIFLFCTLLICDKYRHCPVSATFVYCVCTFVCSIISFFQHGLVSVYMSENS